MKDKYGIIGMTKPKKEFFDELAKPVDPKLVEKCKDIFKGIKNVKVIKG